MAKRMNFPNRVKARREGALYRLKNLGEKNLPKDPKEREAKQAKRAAEIAVLENRIS